MPPHSQANKIWKNIKLLKEWANDNYSSPYFPILLTETHSLFSYSYESIQCNCETRESTWKNLKGPGTGSYRRPGVSSKVSWRPGRLPKTSSGALLLILRELSWTQGVVQLCLPRSGSKNWKLLEILQIQMCSVMGLD